VAQLRLIREIESQTRGKLTEAGRQYRLLRDIDFEGFAERNSYYVVRQDEAKQVLDAMAKETGTPAELAVLFGKARDQLTRDWHAFTKPDGLILLRRAPVVRAPVADTGPAITPSQFRRMKLGWIIIEVVYESGDPWRGTLKLTMADGSEQSMQLPDDGVVNLENIEPGTVTVKFPRSQRHDPHRGARRVFVQHRPRLWISVVQVYLRPRRQRGPAGQAAQSQRHLSRRRDPHPRLQGNAALAGDRAAASHRHEVPVREIALAGARLGGKVGRRMPLPTEGRRARRKECRAGQRDHRSRGTAVGQGRHAVGVLERRR
jgi:hypothetical protein